MNQTTVTEATKPRLLNERTAARYLGVSQSFLSKSRCRGTLTNHTPGPPYVQAGRAIRYAVADLDGWIAQHRHTPSPAPGVDE